MTKKFKDPIMEAYAGMLLESANTDTRYSVHIFRSSSGYGSGGANNVISEFHPSRKAADEAGGDTSADQHVVVRSTKGNDGEWSHKIAVSRAEPDIDRYTQDDNKYEAISRAHKMITGNEYVSPKQKFYDSDAKESDLMDMINSGDSDKIISAVSHRNSTPEMARIAVKHSNPEVKRAAMLHNLNHSAYGEWKPSLGESDMMDLLSHPKTRSHAAFIIVHHYPELKKKILSGDTESDKKLISRKARGY